MKRTLRIVFTLMLAAAWICGTPLNARAAELSRTFEFRYFSSDPGANGETDFRGKTSVFDTDERIRFLEAYTDYAARDFGVPELNEKIIAPGEAAALLRSIKPQPLPEIRRRIPLNTWRTAGYKDGQVEARRHALAAWTAQQGADLVDGYLRLTGSNVSVGLPKGLDWRANIQWRMRVSSTAEGSLALTGDKTALLVGIDKAGNVYSDASGDRRTLGPVKPGAWVAFSLDIDCAEKEFCLYVDKEPRAYGQADGADVVDDGELVGTTREKVQASSLFDKRGRLG